MKQERIETRETAYKILAYLMDNPDAQDTLEGIMDWWLLQQDIKRNVAVIKMTVEKLTHEGFLLERHGIDMRKYYHVNQEKVHEITALIEKK